MKTFPLSSIVLADIQHALIFRQLLRLIAVKGTTLR